MDIDMLRPQKQKCPNAANCTENVYTGQMQCFKCGCVLYYPVHEEEVTDDEAGAEEKAAAERAAVERESRVLVELLPPRDAPTISLVSRADVEAG